MIYKDHEIRFHTNFEIGEGIDGDQLGLWLVQGIAKQLDGTVNYIEHNDKIEFQLWLPQLKNLTMEIDDFNT